MGYCLRPVHGGEVTCPLLFSPTVCVNYKEELIVIEVVFEELLNLAPNLLDRAQSLLGSGAIDSGSYDPRRLSQVVLVAAMRDEVAEFRVNQREREDLENLTHF